MENPLFKFQQIFQPSRVEKADEKIMSAKQGIIKVKFCEQLNLIL